MELQPHQRKTIEFSETSCTNQHGLLVFHNMGTGKTNTAIGWLINRQALYKNYSKNTQKNNTIQTKTKKRRRTSHSKTQRKRMRAGSSSKRNESSHSSSESSSESSTASRKRSTSNTTKNTPTQKRDFDYVIVCPGTAKGSDKQSQNGFPFRK